MHKENTDRNIRMKKSKSTEVENGKSSENKISAGKSYSKRLFG